MSKILYESNYALLTYDKNHRILELLWKVSCSEDEYKNFFNEILTVLENKPIDNFISDLRGKGVISIERLNWIKQEVLPRVLKTDVKKIALLIKKEMPSEIYASAISSRLNDSSIDFSFFNDLDEAKVWLQS